MGNNEYLESLINELKSEGVVVPTNNIESVAVQKEDRELQIILEMESMTNKKYSDEQIKILRHHGNAVILACAGSGKTTICTHLIAKRIKTGEIRDVNKLIYATYSKAGAEEMKERLDILLKQLGLNVDVKVQTLHSFFLQIIRTFGITAGIIENSARAKAIKDACKIAGFPLRGDDLQTIDNLLSYQVNNLLSDKKTIESYVNTLDDLTLEQYSNIRKLYANKKNELGLIDFDDMQSYLYLWLVKFGKSSKQNERDVAKSVRDYCKAMWTDFYIDEAQDTSKIQFAIVRAIVEDENNNGKLSSGLVFIGDDDQAIYTWRGGDPSIILSTGPTFDIPTFVLSTNYRCKEDIVKFAATAIKCNDIRYKKDMQSFGEGKGDVKIKVTDKDDLCTLSISAKDHIKYLKDNGEELSDIAVLSRNNFHLAILSNMLLREGIYCTMTNEMKLTKSFMYKEVKSLLNICKNEASADDTAKLLWKLSRFMGPKNSAVIADFQSNTALTLRDVTGWITKKFINTDVEFEQTFNVNLELEKSIQHLCNRMSRDSLNDIEVLYKAFNEPDLGTRMVILENLYMGAAGFLYKSKDKNRSILGLFRYINNLIIKDGFDKCLDFLRITEQLEYGRMEIPGDKITLSTIHSSKGREWKHVIMFACDNVSQPSFDGINSMLQEGISIHDVCENIDEERRLFYVGCTRAKDTLTLIANAPSIFILEALGLNNSSTSGSNTKIIGIANSGEWTDSCKKCIVDNILNKESKYFYNIDRDKEDTKEHE